MADQLFISYSSADRPWATRLVRELRNRFSLASLRIYFDQTSLRAGDTWEKEIHSALAASKHIIVLWSKNAKQSDWVNRERGLFDARIHASNGADGRMIFILLDDEPLSFASLQNIPVIRDTAAFGSPVEQTRPQMWVRVVDAIESGIKGEVRKIPVAALTITRERLSTINFYQKPDFPGSIALNDILDNLGIGTVEEASKYYDDTRQKWKPFGGTLTIETILDNVRSQLIDDTHATFAWEWMDDALWSDCEATVEEAAKRLAREQSVVVIDPLALYESRLKEVLQRHLPSWLRNGDSTIMVLSIYPTWERPRYLRQMVNQINKAIVDRHDNADVGLELTIPHATCSVFTGDEADIKRLLRSMLRAQLGRQKPRHAVLRSK